MSSIIPVDGASTALSHYPATIAASASSASAPFAPTGDVAEFSSFGRALARAADLSSFSLAKIRALREEIANGTFETQQRLAGTVDRLIDVLA